jgi:hypothetical protein
MIGVIGGVTTHRQLGALIRRTGLLESCIYADWACAARELVIYQNNMNDERIKM